MVCAYRCWRVESRPNEPFSAALGGLKHDRQPGVRGVVFANAESQPAKPTHSRRRIRCTRTYPEQPNRFHWSSPGQGVFRRQQTAEVALGLRNIGGMFHIQIPEYG